MTKYRHPFGGRYIWIIAIFFFCGCKSNRFSLQHPAKVNVDSENKIYRPKLSSLGWHQHFNNDANLAGIEVMQYPEVATGEAYESYRNKHPAHVTYCFWDGSMICYQFTPDGEVIDMSDPGFRLSSPNDWCSVDFRFGSDPNFRTHRDPRR